MTRSSAVLGMIGMLVAALSIGAGCTKSRDAAPDASTRTAVWGELQLRVPADAETKSSVERFDMTRRPGSRTPDTLTLRRSSPDEDAALRRDARSTAALPGGQLAYRIERTEGGSGGAEAKLVGAVVIASTTYRVECHAQSELPEPAGDWCVPTLLTLERR